MAPPLSGQIQSGAKPDAGIQDVMFGSKSADANTPDEQERVKQVMSMFQKAKQWKATWAKDFDRWWNLWESNHYKNKTSTSLTQAVVNQIWASVETFIGHVTDALPDPIARARRSNYKDKAALITKWLKYENDSNDVEQEIQHAVRSACVTGLGWFKVSWNPEKSGKRGDVDIIPRDEKFIFTSPYARNVRELLYLIDASNVPREFVVRNWEKGELVPPGAMDMSLMNVRNYAEDNKSSAPTNLALLTTTTGSDSRWTSSTGLMGGKKSDLVTLLECWTREADGTMRYTVVANGVLLQDGPSPYDDEDFPYAPFNVIPTMDSIYGRGICQFIEGLQELLNNSLSLLIDQQRFASDPMMVVDSVNLDEGTLIENSPGGILPNVSEGEGYRWMTAPGFNQAWLDIQKILSEYMDSVLGRVDVLKGERPVGVSTLGGLEIVRDEANVRIRNLIRWIKASLKRTNLLVLSRLRQFAKDERTVRIVGKLGKEEFATVNEVKGVGLGGELEQDVTIPDDAEFDVEFAKEAPGGRQAKQELALTLINTIAEDGLPCADRQYVLETCEIEEAPELMERLGQQAAAQAEAEAQAAGGGMMQPEQDPLDSLVKTLMSGGTSSPSMAPPKESEEPKEQGQAPASGSPVAPPVTPQQQPSGRVVDVVRDSKGRAVRFNEQYVYQGAGQ